MDEEVKERKCKTCGKRLIDEKLPICLRCRLKGRNNAGKVGEIAVGTVLAIAGGKALIDQNQNNGNV